MTALSFAPKAKGDGRQKYQYQKSEQDTDCFTKNGSHNVTQKCRSLLRYKKFSTHMTRLVAAQSLGRRRAMQIANKPEYAILQYCGIQEASYIPSSIISNTLVRY
jgi:hypothetical protein